MIGEAGVRMNQQAGTRNVAMTRARDRLYVVFPLRYHHRKQARGDAHSYARLLGEWLPMSSAEDVTYWIARLKGGDPAAAQPLWERYFKRLVRLAHQKLRDLPRGAADEQDVALSA
jgi:hypothetical protein